MLFLIEKPENKFRLVEAPIPEKSELLEMKVLVVGSIAVSYTHLTLPTIYSV